MNMPFQDSVETNEVAKVTKVQHKDVFGIDIADWNTRGPSVTSAFMDMAELSERASALSETRRFAVAQYIGMISTRMEYLSSLSGLGPNWISDSSERPSKKAISASKALLHQFSGYIRTKRNARLPKLVMGPIPSGGISIEFHVDEANALFISIRNRQRPEIEVKYADYYFTYNTDTQKLPARLMENYEAITEK